MPYVPYTSLDPEVMSDYIEECRADPEFMMGFDAGLDTDFKAHIQPEFTLLAQDPYEGEHIPDYLYSDWIIPDAVGIARTFKTFKSELEGELPF